MKKAVQFGAGNIGRGFIGALLSQSGYHVVFADVVDKVIDKINEDKTFAIDDTGAQAVRTIFDMFIKEKSNAEICAYLNEHGFETCQGNPFNKNSIPRIIKNDKYIGVYRCGDVCVEGGVPPIITKGDFLLAQRELKRRKTSKQARAPKAEYLLSGKLFCGDCRKAMVGVSGTGKSK